MIFQHQSVIVVFLRPQWQICGCKICPFPQFTANFIIFHETILVFTIFEHKSMVFRGDKVPKVSIVHFFHFHTIVLNLPVCFKLLYWKLPGRCLTLLNRVLSTLSFTCGTIEAVIYTALFLLPVFFSLVLES